LRARLYLIDAETAQSASAPGNALRITAIPSRCPRDSGPDHVIRHAPQHEWTPESALFSVDDRVVYRWAKRIDAMTLPQNVLLTIWASSSAEWAGPVTDETGLAAARFDWVELYDYSPAEP
jgi:beta-glucanase (GH16 family)